jgi:hypothetical protein
VKGNARYQAVSARFEPEVIEDNVKELPEPMHGNFQVGRIEQAQAKKLQGAAAHRTGEDARHFIVEFNGEGTV